MQIAYECRFLKELTVGTRQASPSRFLECNGFQIFKRPPKIVSDTRLPWSHCRQPVDYEEFYCPVFQRRPRVCFGEEKGHLKEAVSAIAGLCVAVRA
jgi:hypothetical protein